MECRGWTHDHLVSIGQPYQLSYIHLGIPLSLSLWPPDYHFTSGSLEMWRRLSFHIGFPRDVTIIYVCVCYSNRTTGDWSKGRCDVDEESFQNTICSWVWRPSGVSVLVRAVSWPHALFGCRNQASLSGVFMFMWSLRAGSAHAFFCAGAIPRHVFLSTKNPWYVHEPNIRSAGVTGRTRPFSLI